MSKQQGQEEVDIQAKRRRRNRHRRKCVRLNTHISYDATGVSNDDGDCGDNNTMSHGDWLVVHDHMEPTISTQIISATTQNSKLTFETDPTEEELEQQELEKENAWAAMAQLLHLIMLLPPQLRDVISLMIINPTATSSEISRMMHTATSTQQRREEILRTKHNLLWKNISAYRRRKGIQYS